MADLVIKIAGDAAEFKKALGEAGEAAKELDGGLKGLGVVAGAAFAALSGEVIKSVSAFAQSEKAVQKLSQAMQTQGIYSKELRDSYIEQADELENLTGIDNDSIVAAQAQLQSYLGQTKVSKELTQAVLDLSVAKGIDLNTASELVGKTISGTTNVLQRQGVVVDASADKMTKIGQVIDGVNSKWKDQSVAANQGLGALKGLEVGFDNIQKAIGKELTPAIEAIIPKITKFFQEVAADKPLISMIANMIKAGLVVSGLVSAFVAVTVALPALTAAIGVSTGGLSLIIGGLALAVYELGTHWDDVWSRLSVVVQAFVDNTLPLLGNIGKAFSALVTGDFAQFKQGLLDAKDAAAALGAEATKPIKVEVKKTETSVGAGAPGGPSSGANYKPPSTEEDRKKVSADISKIADQLAKGGEGAASAISNAAGVIGDKLLPGIGGAVTSIIAILALGPEKVKEVISGFFAALPGVINAIIDSIPVVMQTILDSLQVFLVTIVDSLPVLIQNLVEGAIQFVATLIQQVPVIILALAAQVGPVINALIAEAPKLINELIRLSFLFINALTLQAPMIAVQLATNLAAQMPFIATMFAIELIKNLPSIVLTFAQEFLKIPGLFLNELLAGIRGALGNLGGALGFADGGLATGGIPGQDSIPAMVQPGELMVPPQNFNEVVNAVATQRTGQPTGGATPGGGGGGSILIGFDGQEASRVLTARQIGDRALGISPESAFAT